jgi:hypothetical protein
MPDSPEPERRKNDGTSAISSITEEGNPMRCRTEMQTASASILMPMPSYGNKIFQILGGRLYEINCLI